MIKETKKKGKKKRTQKKEKNNFFSNPKGLSRDISLDPAVKKIWKKSGNIEKWELEVIWPDLDAYLSLDD